MACWSRSARPPLPALAGSSEQVADGRQTRRQFLYAPVLDLQLRTDSVGVEGFQIARIPMKQ